MTATRDLTAEVTELRTQVDQLRDEQARAEARFSAAEEEHTRLLSQLTREFEVGSLDEARELLSSVDTALAAEVDSIRSALARTGTQQ